MPTLNQRLAGQVTHILMQEGISPESKITNLFDVCRQSQSFVLDKRDLSLINQKLISSVFLSKPEEIPALSLAITQWAKIISHGENSAQRDILLEHEERLINCVNELAPEEGLHPMVSGYVLSCLQYFHESSRCASIVQALLKHLDINQANHEVMSSSELSRALLSLKAINPEDETGQAIIRTLAWEVTQNAEGEDWFEDYPLALVFLTLQDMPCTKEVEVLLQSLFLHLHHKTRGQQYIDKRYCDLIKDGLKKMPQDNETVVSVLKDLSVHSQSSISSPLCDNNIDFTNESRNFPRTETNKKRAYSELVDSSLEEITEEETYSSEEYDEQKAYDSEKNYLVEAKKKKTSEI